jgi:hypothetical protein
LDLVDRSSFGFAISLLERLFFFHTPELVLVDENPLSKRYLKPSQFSLYEFMLAKTTSKSTIEAIQAHSEVIMFVKDKRKQKIELEKRC